LIDAKLETGGNWIMRLHESQVSRKDLQSCLMLLLGQVVFVMSLNVCLESLDVFTWVVIIALKQPEVARVFRPKSWSGCAQDSGDCTNYGNGGNEFNCARSSRIFLWILAVLGIGIVVFHVDSFHCWYLDLVCKEACFLAEVQLNFKMLIYLKLSGLK
jgi:hypothetical protein